MLESDMSSLYKIKINGKRFALISTDFLPTWHSKHFKLPYHLSLTITHTFTHGGQQRCCAADLTKLLFYYNCLFCLHLLTIFLHNIFIKQCIHPLTYTLTDLLTYTPCSLCNIKTLLIFINSFSYLCVCHGLSYDNGCAAISKYCTLPVLPDFQQRILYLRSFFKTSLMLSCFPRLWILVRGTVMLTVTLLSSIAVTVKFRALMLPEKRMAVLMRNPVRLFDWQQS